MNLENFINHMSFKIKDDWERLRAGGNGDDRG